MLNCPNFGADVLELFNVTTNFHLSLSFSLSLSLALSLCASNGQHPVLRRTGSWCHNLIEDSFAESCESSAVPQPTLVSSLISP